VDGVANAAEVTISGSNPYKWSVTLPSLTAGQRVDMYITGTIATIATAGFVASEQADTALVSEVKTETAAILADTGTDGVKIANTQPAITWGQQKIVADVSNEGALDIRNSHTNGIGLFNSGNVAQFNDGGSVGVVNDGTVAVMGFATAIATASNLQTVDDIVDTIKTDTAAILDDTGTAGVVLKAAGLNADAVTKIQNGLATQNDIENMSPTVWLQDGSITATTFATDAISAAAVRADAVTKLQANLALEATLTAIKGAGWDTQTLAAIDVLIDAIKAKTDNLPADPADDSDIDSQLAAIKAVVDNVHDTDLPAVKAETASILEDTGTTLPATLATLAGYTDGIAGDVWSHSIRTLTNQGLTVTTPATGDPLEIYRDTTVPISITGLGATTGYTKIWFTVKEDLEDLDTAAVLQVATTDGLKYLDGAAGTPTDGTLVIDNDLHTATITIQQASAALLPVYAAYPIPWDLKMLNAGIVSRLAEGTMYIKSTPTRSIS
jgi:hypothetical protein